MIYDGSALNYAILERMPESAKKVDEQNLTLLPKAIKNPVEVANIRQAHIKDGIALTKFMYWLKKNIGKVPMTEISAAEKMESFRKEQEGYLEPSLNPPADMRNMVPLCIILQHRRQMPSWRQRDYF